MKGENGNIIFVIISLIMAILLTPNINEEFNSSKVFILSLLAFVNVVFFWLTTNRYTRSWVNYNTLFLLGFLIVHFQIPFLASLGVEPNRSSFIWINKNVVNFAVWMSLMALFFWELGYFLYRKLRKKRILKKITSYNVNTKKIDFFLQFFFVLFIALVGKEFLSGSYDGGDNWGSGANYAFMLLRVLIYLRVIYFFINTRNFKITKKNIIFLLIRNKRLFIVLSLYVLLFLLAGDRGPVMQILILLAVSYSIFQRKISFKAFFVSIIIGGVLFTIIGMGRSRDTSQRSMSLFEEGYNKLIQSENTINPTNELASSNRILFRAIDVVPDKHPYLLGTTFFNEVIGVVPFAGGTYLKLTELPLMYTSSSYFFTVLGQGVHFSYGEGSEILGDIYINFGVIGVFIMMFLLGGWVSYIIFNVEKNNYYNHTYIIIYVIICIGALYINRSHFLDPLKSIVYALVIDRLLVRKNIKWEQRK
ncbi:O-antigen polymerase [Tenacibaculum sp. IB213877]|uniref:O-antigen polymerase n=1 Tax=Tenacibaculum sp. IB213877 TaxID=3097351 RepID=UPI002A5A3667|nr:O-antigen polymerase [Tenacibaculum sp. IB213877]MDY0781368.1 O-antigen polymerase [Tenacibaculum sp. IB213877]